MGQGHDRQEGEDPVIAEGDIEGDCRKTDQQRHHASLQQLGAQGGANGIHRGTSCFQGAGQAIDAGDHRLALVCL